jgi:hypothetical protein
MARLLAAVFGLAFMPGPGVSGTIARLSLGFSKELECLEARLALFLAYNSFVWRTRFPGWSGRRGKRRPPAAMIAGVKDRL